MGEAVDSVGEEEGGQAWAEPPFAGPALPFLPALLASLVTPSPFPPLHSRAFPLPLGDGC